MTNETKVIIALLALYLWFHWSTLTAALATGGAGAAGSVTPGSNSTGGPLYAGGPGNARPTAFPETWGTDY